MELISEILVKIKIKYPEDMAERDAQDAFLESLPDDLLWAEIVGGLVDRDGVRLN